MKRLITFLALAGLTALLGGCGGEEETGILALAFRLDGESPIVTAYIGDPNEDPFQPPAGRYYIEAVDQDDVAISLGAVEVEDGAFVDFASSFEAAGGVADAERAESLKTVATFLIDFELSELTFIEAITGGFTTEDPFDPAVDPDAASVQELLDLYAEMADQEEVLEAALSEIEGRVEVSAGISYVRSPWAPAPDLIDVAKKKLDDWEKSTFSFFHNATVVRQRKRILEIADKIPEDEREEVFSKLSSDKQGDAANFDDWLDKVRTDDDFVRTEGSGIYYELDGLDHGAVVDSGNSAIDVLAEEGPKGANYAKDKVLEAYKSVPVVGKLIDTTEKALELEAWAKQFVKDPGAAMDKAFRDHLQKQLAERWKAYLKERAVDLPSLTDTGIDKLAEYLAKKAVDKLPKPPSLRTPAATAGPPGASPAVPTPKATPKVTPSASPAVPTPQVTPGITPSPSPASDTGWIEGYVSGIASEWVANCFKGAVKPYADALRQCLINAMMDGATEEQAKVDCPPDVYAPAFPDAGWIEGYVSGIADQWLAKDIYSGIDVAVAADDMRQCLTDRFLTLCLSEEESKAECPAWLFEPSLPVETPSPSPSPSPSPQPTPSPSPEPQQVTAKGQYVMAPVLEGETVVWNTITLTFSTAGGPGSVEGTGHWDTQTPSDDLNCPPTVLRQTLTYEGAYNPEDNTFIGTYKVVADGTYFFEECEVIDWDTLEEECHCEEGAYSDSTSGIQWTGIWGEDGVIRGSVGGDEFLLDDVTPQGQ
jgi:hypothetical protein